LILFRAEILPIESRTERAVRRGDDMSTISEAGIVVFAFLVSMPEIDHSSAKWAAASRQHNARKFKLTAWSAGLAQVAALRGSWLEKRPLGLADGWFITVVTEIDGDLVSMVFS
jgi:hypothetical protein